ncbi:MAG: M28 family metallopeptidase, partial [Saprospiraceae bacterium]
KSVEWAYNKFKEAGVEVEKHEFTMPVLWLEKAVSMSIKMPDETSTKISAVAKYQTAPGKYNSDIIYLSAGDSLDFAKQKNKIKGNFILVDTELCLDIDGLFAEYTHAAKVEELAYQYEAQGILFMASRPKGLLYRFITSKTTDNTLPQFVVAREDARLIGELSKEGKQLKLDAELDAEIGKEFKCENVIAEIKGSEKPEEVIIIGAHLDSWALGTGANDNGCNVSMMIDMARQMKELGIQAKRTIRFALWNGEEQGYFGSWAYTKDHLDEMDKHKLAVSIDIGSGQITGFFTNGRSDLKEMVDELAISQSTNGDTLIQLNIPIVGTDNFDFMMQGVPNLVGIHKPQVYGVNYHARTDTFDKVDLKMLKQNSATVGAMILAFANQDEINLPRQTRAEIQKTV